MEIGGYFGLEQATGEEYYPNLIAVNSTRNALLYIIKAKKISKIYLPFFLCDSVSELCRKEHIKVDYYHIDHQMRPVFSEQLHTGEYLYIVNYYGILSDKEILAYKEKYQSVIFDYAQAFFQKPIGGVEVVYSCRKFFGVPDGAYLVTDSYISEKLETDVSKDRMKHILGRFEENASQYYENFKENEAKLSQIPLRYMSKLTHNLLKAIDYESVRKKREQNYTYLQEKLKQYNDLKIDMPQGPYAYPFYIEGGMKLKRYLAEKKIYVATLWPNILTLGDGIEKDYAQNILPLPVDQRYGIEDMNFIVQEIQSFMH